jgi:DNA polymerase III epsilon subunit-like protein
MVVVAVRVAANARDMKERPASYSDNIVFFDTEFTDLDPSKGHMLSLALVRPTGEELYVEFELPKGAPIHPWTKENVMPKLEGIAEPLDTAREKIRAFVEAAGEPYLMSYVSQFDALYWMRLFGYEKKDNPAFWITLDFASITFARGFHPGSFGFPEFNTSLGIDVLKYREHHALDDARLLKEAYGRFFRSLKS